MDGRVGGRLTDGRLTDGRPIDGERPMDGERPIEPPRIPPPRIPPPRPPRPPRAQDVVSQNVNAAATATPKQIIRYCERNISIPLEG